LKISENIIDKSLLFTSNLNALSSLYSFASDLIAYEEKLIEQLASLLVTSPPPGRIGG